MDQFGEQFINKQFGDSRKDIMNDFLPKEYEVPKSQGNYMKFNDPVNKFRVLSSAIVGFEWWTGTADGKRVPGRSRTWDEAVEQGVDPIKPFWAFVVWNYQTETINILEITQISIMRAIKEYVDNPEWGNPKKYDFTVSKTGKLKETRYSVMPSPSKSVDPAIIEQYKSMSINLNALYAGDDPFGDK